MKKVLATFCVLACLFVPFTLARAEVDSDGVESIEEIESVEEVVTETSVIEETQTDVLTEEQFKTTVEQYLSAYMSESLLQKVITWLVDAGILSAMFVVYLKYRKYKHNTTEEVLKAVKAETGKYLTDNFKELSKAEIQSIVNKMETLEKSTETIMKVLVLMQDNTAKGKVALIDYLGAKTESEEVKQAVVEVNETLEKQEEKAQIVNEKVKGDYQKIF